MNKAAFYKEIKKAFGPLKQSQVDGFEADFNEWDLWVSKKWVNADIRKLAYILATDWHETATTMQAIKEFGGNAYLIKMYWTNQRKAKELGNIKQQDAIDFGGKGKCQTTGRANYTKLGKILGYDFINNPALMLDLKIATEVMFEGMLTGRSFKGDFTGKHLGNYFTDKIEDPYNARKIINGLDKAQHIVYLYNIFLAALKAN